MIAYIAVTRRRHQDEKAMFIGYDVIDGGRGVAPSGSAHRTARDGGERRGDVGESP